MPLKGSLCHTFVAKLRLTHEPHFSDYLLQRFVEFYDERTTA